MTELRTFRAKDGRKVVLRSVKWEDLNDLLEFINSLVQEGADILRTEKVSRKEEAEWLSKRLTRIEKGELIDIVAEVGDKVIANSEVEKGTGFASHVGHFGIAVRSGYRGIGIGTQIMKAIIEESKKANLKLLVLSVFETNKAARELYEKMGFRETGRTPRYFYRDGQYIDQVRMVLEL